MFDVFYHLCNPRHAPLYCILRHWCVGKWSSKLHWRNSVVSMRKEEPMYDIFDEFVSPTPCTMRWRASFRDIMFFRIPMSAQCPVAHSSPFFVWFCRNECVWNYRYSAYLYSCYSCSSLNVLFPCSFDLEMDCRKSLFLVGTLHVMRINELALQGSSFVFVVWLSNTLLLPTRHSVAHLFISL